MTRDCLKYGVCFVVTTNGANTVRYRLKQNFKQSLALQFNDPNDYGIVIPGARKKEPSKAYGRGLVGLDNVYEFQTAYAYKEEKMSDYIKIVSKKLNEICEYKAPRIPILPETVNSEFVSNYFGSLQTIPVGVEKETLNISTLDLKNTFMYNITGDDVSTDTRFIKGLINNVLMMNNAECIIFDANSILGEINRDRITYSNDLCDAGFERLAQIFANNDPEKVVVCFMYNVSSLLNKLSPEDKPKFTEVINNCKNKGNIRIIVIDTIDAIKQIAFEPWYKSNSDLSEGIWLGNGIANQFTLKVTTNARVLRAEVEPGFGYIIKKGKATLIKLMSDE